MQIKQLLQNKQINRSDNKIILALVTGLNNIQLIIKDDYELNQDELAKYNSLLQRVMDKEPLAYIVGKKEFYSREFTVTPATLIPRPETELLVELTINLAKSNATILDLGTGTGCIAITTKLERPDTIVTAVDNYPETLTIAQQNAMQLNANVQFVQSNWLSSIKHKFDIIVSNPPYIESEDEHLANLSFEPLHALTDFKNGLSAIEHIIQHSTSHLNDTGYLIFEHGYNQAEKVQQILYNYAFTNIKTIQDYAGLDRITYGQFAYME